MSETAKALIVVLAVGILAFYLSRQIAVQSVPRREFAVWRTTWFAVTIAAFLSGNIFVFMSIEAMICLYAVSTGLAGVGLFYVLLFTAPMVSVPIGGIGSINYFFEINNCRLLAGILLLPALFAKHHTNSPNRTAYRGPDLLVVSYTVLLVALQFRQSDLTNVMRVGLLRTLDILLPYFAFSRTVHSVLDFRKALLAYVIAVLPLSMIAVVEVVKGWHLFAGIASDWGEPLFYLRRNGLLRATGPAPTGPIVLGYVFMTAIGCMFALWERTGQLLGFARVASICLAAGLIAALSRGPWVGTSVLITSYFAMGPKAAANLAKIAIIALVGVVFLILTPIGEKIIDFLPFVGSVDVENVTYRELLVQNALIVIERYPFLGSSDYLSTPEMRALIQGEGIIDTVNTYLGVALESGLIGLSLFIAFFATILVGLRRTLRFAPLLNDDLSRYVRASIATLSAIIVTIGTVSSVDFIPYFYWSFAGLCVALIRIAHTRRAEAARDSYVESGGERPLVGARLASLRRR